MSRDRFPLLIFGPLALPRRSLGLERTSAGARLSGRLAQVPDREKLLAIAAERAREYRRLHCDRDGHEVRALDASGNQVLTRRQAAKNGLQPQAPAVEFCMMCGGIEWVPGLGLAA
jgi:hypothetical protein